MFQKEIQYFSSIVQYFKDKEFLEETSPNVFKAKIDGNDGFKVQTSNWLETITEILEKLSNSKEFSAKELILLKQGIKECKSFLMGFHEPLLTGIEEEFKTEFFTVCEDILLEVNNNVKGLYPNRPQVKFFEEVLDYVASRGYASEIEYNFFRIDVDNFRVTTQKYISKASKFLENDNSLQELSADELYLLKENILACQRALENLHEPELSASGVEQTFLVEFSIVSKKLLSTIEQIDKLSFNKENVYQATNVTPEDKPNILTTHNKRKKTKGEKAPHKNDKYFTQWRKGTSQLKSNQNKSKEKKIQPNYENLPAFTTNLFEEPTEDFDIYHYVPRSFISEQPWVDIPKAQDLKILNDMALLEKQQESPERPATTLLRMINAYHGLAKTDESTLLLRIKMLGFINRYVNDIFDSLPEGATELNDLVQKTCNKALYLGAIQERLQEHEYLEEGVSLYYGEGKSIKSSHIKGLEVTRSIGGGDHMLGLDPCYRHQVGTENLNPLFDEWKQKNPEPHLPGQFLLWLEDQENLFKNIKMDFTYYDPTQGDRSKQLRKTSRLKMMVFSDNLVFVDNNLEPLNSLVNIEYVISSKNEVWLNYNLNNKEKGGNHPTMIEDGKPVVCAGHITIADGKITHFDNNSGHYQPSPHQLWQALCLLNNRGLINENATIQLIKSDNVIEEYSFADVKQSLVDDPRYKEPPKDSIFVDATSKKLKSK